MHAQLVAEGYLATTPHGGTRVTAQRTLVAATADADKPIQVPRVAGHNPGQPDPALFPRRDWAHALASTVARVPDGDLLYGDQQSSTNCARCSPHTSAARGIVTDAEHVMVVSGFAQTLACMAALLRTR